jgi:hypothetical protein
LTDNGFRAIQKIAILHPCRGVDLCDPGEVAAVNVLAWHAAIDIRFGEILSTSNGRAT